MHRCAKVVGSLEGLRYFADHVECPEPEPAGGVLWGIAGDDFYAGPF
jgi:hypothetical protein